MLPARPMRRGLISSLLLTLLAGPALAQEPPAASGPPVEPPVEPAAEFTPAQQAWIEAAIARRIEDARPRYSLRFDVFMKGLYQNDQSNGSVWLGNPHPEGDNYSGSNGVAGVLGIHIDGRVVENITAGGRLETRFGQQFADFYENGDLRVDDNGRPSGVDATGESLGMNHAAYAQLRGLYIQWDRPTPIPTVTRMRAGSSDLSHWNPWTVGKIRFIDRDNAKGFFFFGESGLVDYNLARVALPKLYASAGFNTGIADPLIENPFWARDAVYVGRVTLAPAVGGLQKPRWEATVIGSYLLDEEADLDDPDALGSTNLLDDKDGVVTTIPRYTNLNATLEGAFRPRGGVDLGLLLGFSHSDPDMGLVDNSVDNNQGLSPIPLATVSGYAVRARGEWEAAAGISLRAEYFNIGEDWVATMGARREEDVLLTEGFLDGQLPTLNIANEFMDFTEPFYETIIGWHGGTLKPRLALGPIDLEVEGTLITYNTNEQGRCTSEAVEGCEDRTERYPDFLFPDGMTDTDFFTFANTNDRGRDPRAAYRAYQKRLTWLGAVRAGLGVGGGRVELFARYIRDKDLRDERIVGEDDYLGNILTAQLRGQWKIGPRAQVGGGARFDYWDEAHRSGAVVAGTPRFPDYETVKSKVWLEARYDLPSASFSYRIELLNKDVETSDPSLDFTYRNVVRSLAMLYAGF